MHHGAMQQSGHDDVQTMAGGTLGGWTLIERLGAGPVSESWLATRGAGAERAVVRILSAPFAGDECARLEWARASWAANRFHHARVVKVIEQHTGSRGEPVIVRRFARGESLESAVRRGVVDVTLALRLGEQLLDALEMAHAHGIAHGALTPANVIVTARGSVRVVDFATTPGLRARRSGFSGVLAPARWGPYSAPECRPATAEAGEAVPPRSEQTDVWSVGACVHFALTGCPPDAEGHSGAPRAALAGASEDVSAVIAMALSRNPVDRYESAYAMLGDVRRLISGRKPKLDGALAPVPSQSFARTASLPPPGPASSSGLRGIDADDSGRKDDADAEPAGRQWRGNLLLFMAIATLVGLATFVLVRERLSETHAAPADRSTPGEASRSAP